MLLPVVIYKTKANIHVRHYFLCSYVSYPFNKYFLSAGVPVDDRNWPPFFPIIHHDIANEIPIHAQKLQYLAFASWLGGCAFHLIEEHNLILSSQCFLYPCLNACS